MIMRFGFVKNRYTFGGGGDGGGAGDGLTCTFGIIYYVYYIFSFLYTNTTHAVPLFRHVPIYRYASNARAIATARIVYFEKCIPSPLARTITLYYTRSPRFDPSHDTVSTVGTYVAPGKGYVGKLYAYDEDVSLNAYISYNIILYTNGHRDHIKYILVYV